MLTPGALSQTGRFFAWHEIRHKQGTCAVRVYDQHSCTLNELENPMTRLTCPTQFLFTKNEESLLGVFGGFEKRSRQITQILIWKCHGSTFRLWAAKTIRGDLSGCHFDEQDQHLYVASEDRIWSRLNLADKEMWNLDSELSEAQYVRIEHRVSQDGKRMAILRQNNNK